MYDFQKYIIRILQPLNTFAKRNVFQIFVENILRIYRRKPIKEKLISLLFCIKIFAIFIITLIFTPLSLIILATKYRFLSIDLSQIGSFLWLDTFIKESLLKENSSKYIYIVHSHPSHISNSYFLERYDQYILQVKNIIQYILLLPFANNILLTFNIKKYEPINKYSRTRIIQNKHYEKTNKPLISIPDTDLNICGEILYDLGIKEKNPKFIIIHVRESGFYSNKKISYRNGNIKDYIDGIKYLTDKGYYVIRLGDNSMSNIDDLVAICNGRLIDYANSVYISEIMDVFLFSECEFLVCTNSGPTFIPVIFQKNICATNYYPLHESLGLIEGDISIFKKIVNINDGNYVSLETILNSELCMPLQYPEHVKQGLKLIDNTADEILWAIKDFLTKNHDPENKVFQEYACGLFKQGQWHGSFGSKGEYSIHYLKEYLSKTGEINNVNLS